jgi:hypothetical protein
MNKNMETPDLLRCYHYTARFRDSIRHIACNKMRDKPGSLASEPFMSFQVYPGGSIEFSCLIPERLYLAIATSL